MKMTGLGMSLILVLILMATISAGAQPLEERLQLIVDVGPYVTLEAPEDIEIEVNQPWSGGELMEASSRLYLKTNTDVKLTWESTELKDEKTGRVLPLGIPENRGRGQADADRLDQAFGLTSFLIKDDDRGSQGRGQGNQQGNGSNNRYTSRIEEGILHSQQGYRFEPGDHNFDIIVQYFWSEEASWSEIVAGRYSGEIIYTVSAIDDREDE